MKSNWIPMKPNTTQQTDRSDLMRKIYELIDWYDVNSTRKEDDYVKAHLKLVIHLAENIEDSDDLMFIEKIADTFCDIIKKQREVIETLEDEAKFQLTHTSSQYNHLPSCVASAEGFSNDDQIKAAFFNFITNDSKKKRSSFTAND